jgi:hypothetical protein
MPEEVGPRHDSTVTKPLYSGHFQIVRNRDWTRPREKVGADFFRSPGLFRKVIRPDAGIAWRRWGGRAGGTPNARPAGGLVNETAIALGLVPQVARVPYLPEEDAPLSAPARRRMVGAPFQDFL